MTLQIGINARLFPNNWRPAPEEIAFASAHGFVTIQLPGSEQGLNVERLGDTLPAVRDALHTAKLLPVMEIMLRIDEVGRTANERTPLDMLEANLEAITTLNCVCVHWHLVPATPMLDIQLQALEEALIPQFEIAVSLAEHNHFRFGVEHNEPLLGLYATPEGCEQLLTAVPGLGFVWDLNHTIPAHLAAFLALTPRMNMLHVSDTPLPIVNSHLPLGMGTIDFEAYCKTLLDRGFDGPAILEIGGLPQSGGYGRDTDAALIDSHERLATIVARLQR